MHVPIKQWFARKWWNKKSCIAKSTTTTASRIVLKRWTPSCSCRTEKIDADPLLHRVRLYWCPFGRNLYLFARNIDPFVWECVLVATQYVSTSCSYELFSFSSASLFCLLCGTNLCFLDLSTVTNPSEDSSAPCRLY